MADIQVLGSSQTEQWQRVLLHSYQYDFYHLPQYHALAEENSEGFARLFVFSQDPHHIAVPLLLRAVDTIPGLARAGQGWLDATSVYGYAGPLSSQPSLPQDVVSGFQSSFSAWLRDMGVVSLFSRLHPLLAQEAILPGIGETISLGSTVSIDLTEPTREQVSRYRKGHRYDISRLQRLGATCTLDQDCVELGSFAQAYNDTMRRVGAGDEYYRDLAYFEQLLGRLHGYLHLFCCHLGSAFLCGGLFALTDGIVQYHLSGSSPDHHELAATKLMIDTVRSWAAERSATVFHLGGGVGSRDDSLYRFKAGFSGRRHPFKVWRWVVQPDVYSRLCRVADSYLGTRGCGAGEATTYFPRYRLPVESDRETRRHPPTHTTSPVAQHPRGPIL